MLWLTKRQLKSADPQARKAAAEKLGRSGDGAAAQMLLAVLRDPEAAVREAAAGALGRLRNPMAADALVSALSDTDPSVQLAVAEALARLQQPSTQGALQAWLERNPRAKEKIRGRIMRELDEARKVH